MSYAPLPPLSPLRGRSLGKPRRRCDEDEEVVCEERPFVLDLLLAFVQGAAPVLAHALIIKFAPSLIEGPPEEEEEDTPDEDSQ